MSYPPPAGQDPNNPYAQQGQQPGYGYPQQQPPAGQAAYGYPQQPPAGYPQQPPAGQAAYGYPQEQQAAYGYPQQAGQPAYGYPQPGAAPGTVQAHNGYINLHGAGTVQLASMGQRFLARLIDGLIVSVLMGIAMAVGLAGAIGVAEEAEACDPMADPAVYNACVEDAASAGMGLITTMVVMLCVLSGLMLVYEWLMISFKGATLGKLAMGLRVLRESTGQFPGVGAGFIRYIIPIAGAFLCYIGTLLVYLSPFFDDSGKLQGWHDRAAGTLVVKVK